MYPGNGKLSHVTTDFTCRIRMLVLVAGIAVLSPRADAQSAAVTYRIEAGEIRTPLAADAGDATRGRAAAAARDGGNCQLCHALPDMQAVFTGTLAPPLHGVGARLTEGQLRLRVVDSSVANRDTIMPAYYRVDGLRQVAAAFREKPILSAQQVEDVVAYLKTLR